MVAVVVKKSENTTNQPARIVEFILEDKWGECWTFRGKPEDFMFDRDLEKHPERVSWPGYLKCRRIGDYRGEDGKLLIVVKTSIKSEEGRDLFEINWDDIRGDGSHNEGSKIQQPISDRKFCDIGIDSDLVRDAYLKMRILPRFLVYECECGPMKVSSLAMYVDCPKCRYGDKIRHLGGGMEVQDLILMAAQWLGLASGDDSPMHSLKLHADDLGKVVDWSEWDRYFKVTPEELQALSDEFALDE